MDGLIIPRADLERMNRAWTEMARALQEIAALPAFKSSGHPDNAGNRANLLAARQTAVAAIAAAKEGR